MERSLTQSLRQQQDEAYELSLRADQEKERIKMLEQLEIQRQQQLVQDEINAEQQKKEVITHFSMLKLKQIIEFIIAI